MTKVLNLNNRGYYILGEREHRKRNQCAGKGRIRKVILIGKY